MRPVIIFLLLLLITVAFSVIQSALWVAPREPWAFVLLNLLHVALALPWMLLLVRWVNRSLRQPVPPS